MELPAHLKVEQPITNERFLRVVVLIVDSANEGVGVDLDLVLF